MSTLGSHAEESRGEVDGRGLRVAVVVARYNTEVTERLLTGARACLGEHGVEEVEVFRVPGAWELPQAAARLDRTDAFDALVTLGCVIRGETPHFEYVCSEVSRGLGAVARTTDTPVVFGVLTTNDLDQALARAGDGPTNKGYEAALSALQMHAFMTSTESL